MSTIERNTSFESLDFDRIEAGIARGRRLQAQAVGSALKTLFSRRGKTEVRGKENHLPDCTAPA
ncbi:MAG: hypothetical protein R3F54_13170 [Alphaproteobacteria bacterium]